MRQGGDWGYANSMGAHYAGIGAAVGSVAGSLYGLSEKGKEYLKNQPEYLASTEHINYKNKRPDADGYISLSEANYWYRNGNGEPLYADLSKIDLSFIRASDFQSDRKITYFQTLFSSNDGRVYGNIGLSLVNGRAVGNYDRYDFDIKRYTNKTTQIPLSLIIRNAATQIGNWFAGNGTPYNIYFYGSYPVKK